MRVSFLSGTTKLIKGNDAIEIEHVPHKGDFVRLDGVIYLVTRLLWTDENNLWRLCIWVEETD